MLSWTSAKLCVRIFQTQFSSKYNVRTENNRKHRKITDLRRLGSFNICQKLLPMFYQTSLASTLLCRDVLRRQHHGAGCCAAREALCWSLISGREKDPGETAVIDHCHPLLHSTVRGAQLPQSCSTDRLRGCSCPKQTF